MNFKKQFNTLVAALFVAILPLAILSSCKDSDDDGVAVTNVAISSDPDNALRYPVEVTVDKDCEVAIDYWPTDEPSKARTTKTWMSTAKVAHPTITFVKASTNYTFAIRTNGKLQSGRFNFTTSELPAGVPQYHVTVNEQGAPTDGYLLQWQATKPGWITFCDMDANIVWYEKFDQAIRMAHYNTEEQKMCVLTGFRDGQNSKNFQRLCDKIITLDLEGNRSVNWVASDDNVPYPHHDIKFTPDGNLIMVCNTIKNFDLSEFDLGDDTPVWGDGFTIITTDGKVTKKWNNFDEYTPFNSNGVILEKGAVYDFLHANSVNWDSDGNYYMTFNRINQLWKIDGKTGNVLYRVGPNGNVALDSEWFASGIHAAVPLAPNKVLCFDNGQDRGYSRALVYEIDPATMSATVTMSVAIPGEYSSNDRSNVQPICDGKMLMFGSTLGRAGVFTDLNGKILKVITRTGISYRTYYYDNI